MKQNEESFLSKEGIIQFKDIQYGKLNVITAPCGSGKTTFVEKKLWKESWWGDLLYLIDSRNALEAFKVRGEKREYRGEVYYKHEGITAMTYKFVFFYSHPVQISRLHSCCKVDSESRAEETCHCFI